MLWILYISIVWRNNALEICKEIGDKKLEGQILHELGDAHRDLAHYPEAIRCLEESLEIYNKSGKFKEECKLYQSLGRTYHSKGEYDKALECHFKSLELIEEYGDDKDIGVSYSNIGSTYNAISKNHEALDYFKRSLEILEKCRNSTIRNNSSQPWCLLFLARSVCRSHRPPVSSSKNPRKKLNPSSK